MSNESARLLNMLGSGVRVTGGADPSASRSARPTGSIDSAPFAELLKQAESGDLSSHRRVSIENGCGVELTEAQSLAVSAAADRAEAAGIRRALVMLDDQALVLDVGTRSITGKAEFSRGVMGGIDGVVKISSETTASSSASPAILPLPHVSPEQLLGLPGARGS